MNKQEIIEFFNERAKNWDKNLVRNEQVINQILDNAGVKEGTNVLDVACGTGVLFPDYIKRQVKKITAIDISPKMVEIAKSKFPNVNVLCGDVETTPFAQKFDSVMVYNAFPHFINPINVIEILANLTKQGGKLSIAHGMSREELAIIHQGAEKVSLLLPTATELAEMMSSWLDIDTVISNDKMYQVVGIKK